MSSSSGAGRPLHGKHIVLGISGGIAAYKAAMLVRLLIRRGAEVQVVITPNGKEFITPATLAALTGKPVVSEFFAANTGEWHSHVDLGLWSDLMIVAPATASTIGKMANGIADNMLITTYLSMKAPVMVAPAMDLDMWAHPSTRRNVAALAADGVHIVEPQSGFLASGLTGKGRMEEPERIAEAAERLLAGDYNDNDNDIAPAQDLAGKKVMITAGPTYENIDPVRFIGNYSSGKMGFALAAACAERGARVALVAGPVDSALGIPEGVTRINVRTAREMLAEALKEFEDSDFAIMAAAVADYYPAEAVDHKLKREHAEHLDIRLLRNPDIAAAIGARKGDRTVVCFALETDEALANARSKMERKGMDMVVVNDANTPGAGFMTDTNIVTIIDRFGNAAEYPMKSKRDVARDIVARMIEVDALSKDS